MGSQATCHPPASNNILRRQNLPNFGNSPESLKISLHMMRQNVFHCSGMHVARGRMFPFRWLSNVGSSGFIEQQAGSYPDLSLTAQPQCPDSSSRTSTMHLGFNTIVHDRYSDINFSDEYRHGKRIARNRRHRPRTRGLIHLMYV
jgi:hypothetical protein